MAWNILLTLIFFLSHPSWCRDFKQRKSEEGKGNLEPWSWFGVRVALQQQGNGWIAKIKFIKIGKRDVKRRLVVLFSIVSGQASKETQIKRNWKARRIQTNCFYPLIHHSQFGSRENEEETWDKASEAICSPSCILLLWDRCQLV